jgi:cytidine deaminase
LAVAQFFASPQRSDCYCVRMKFSTAARARLETSARRAARKAYAPYSKFPVGAAVLAASGKTYTGCNVENAAYGLCNCAERTAIFSAIAAGEHAVTAVAVYTPTDAATTPCGACRQVINEFGPEAIVISICDSEDRIETTLAALLPAAFGPDNLSAASKPRR